MEGNELRTKLKKKRIKVVWLYIVPRNKNEMDNGKSFERQTFQSNSDK